MSPKEKIRCAIYTRKSHEDGLEQEYNSLDAQRDSALNYISSQKHEGWVALPERYDDGGFSGGNMERPAIKRLFADIEKGLIDVVVVYKIDRLSRSIADFVRMIEFFEKNSTVFVSVTQSFNTQNSMGKLMLNILLSFAQFEREVTSERIRDKIASSKARGMWITFKRAGGRNFIISPSESVQQFATPKEHEPLVNALMRAFVWKEHIDNGIYSTVRDIAKKEKISETYVGKVYRLIFLAPDIIEAILDGKQPKYLTLTECTKPFPLEPVHDLFCNFWSSLNAVLTYLCLAGFFLNFKQKEEPCVKNIRAT